MKEKQRFRRRKRRFLFLIHADNSACHHGNKITNKLTAADSTHTPHPPYSPDLNPYDCWLFGFLKESMKGPEFSTKGQIVEAITTICRAITFDTLQFLSPEGMQ
jgi:transposase